MQSSNHKTNRYFWTSYKSETLDLFNHKNFLLSESWGCRHEEILLSCRYHRSFYFFSFKSGFMLEILRNIFPSDEIISFHFILLFYFTLTSKLSFSLKPTRNSINSAFEYKINVRFSMEENSLWEKQLLTLNLQKNII